MTGFIAQFNPLHSTRHRLHIQHHSSIEVQLLLSDGMMYSIVVCTAIGMDCTESAIPPLLFTGRCLEMVCYCDSIILIFIIGECILLRM
jgi:hypothetical protein